MVRTTLNIEDEIYKKLVEESMARYGSTRHLSRIINEKLRLMEKTKRVSKLPEVELGRKIDWKFVEKKIKEIESSWKV